MEAFSEVKMKSYGITELVAVRFFNEIIGALRVIRGVAARMFWTDVN
jgi:hypothetical protein